MNDAATRKSILGHCSLAPLAGAPAVVTLFAGNAFRGGGAARGVGRDAPGRPERPNPHAGDLERRPAAGLRPAGARGCPTRPTVLADRQRVAGGRRAGGAGDVSSELAAQCHRHRQTGGHTLGSSVVPGADLVFAGMREHLAGRARFGIGIGHRHQRGVPVAVDGVGTAVASGRITMHVHILGIAGTFIGGVPSNFDATARLGSASYFVIEADEYDTAFFDKRAKFVHYRPRTAILNNLEYDHADIYPDVAAIRRQFNQLLRTVPAAGRLIVNGDDEELRATLAMGCWTPRETFADGGKGATGAAREGGIGASGADWTAHDEAGESSRFSVHFAGREVAVVEWTLLGKH